MAIKTIEIQDSIGNIYHPHTDSSVVKHQNKKLSDILIDFTGENKILKNSATDTMDFNKLTDSGVYRFGSENDNKPQNISYGQLLVLHGGFDTIAQLCFGYTTNVAYMRMGNPGDVGGSGKWTPWERISTYKIKDCTLVNGAKTAWNDSTYSPRALITGEKVSVTSVLALREVNNESIIIKDLPPAKRPTWLTCLTNNGTKINLYLRGDGQLQVFLSKQFEIDEYVSLNFTYEGWVE